MGRTVPILAAVWTRGSELPGGDVAVVANRVNLVDNLEVSHLRALHNGQVRSLAGTWGDVE